MDLQLRDSKSWSIWRFSFTRKRAMHINVAKVIFSIQNTPLSLCFLITLMLASPRKDYITKKQEPPPRDSCFMVVIEKVLL